MRLGISGAMVALDVCCRCLLPKLVPFDFASLLIGYLLQVNESEIEYLDGEVKLIKSRGYIR